MLTTARIHTPAEHTVNVNPLQLPRSGQIPTYSRQSTLNPVFAILVCCRKIAPGEHDIHVA